MKDREIKLKQDPNDKLITIVASKEVNKEKLSRRQYKGSISVNHYTVNELNEIFRLAKEKGLL